MIKTNGFCEICGILLLKENKKMAKNSGKTQKFWTGFTGKRQLRIRDLLKNAFSFHENAEYASIFQINHQDQKKVSDGLSVDTPKPWIYLRVFFFMVFLSLLVYISTFFLTLATFPFLTLLFASIIPVSSIVFLIEFNKNETIPPLFLVIIFFLGSTLSFLLAIPEIINLTQQSVGVQLIVISVVEEVAKVVPILLFIAMIKPKRIASGILIGFVVGAGFQIFETMGYSILGGYIGVFSTGVLSFQIMWSRLLTSLTTHAVFGAIEGGAIMLCARGSTRYFKSLLRARFWCWFILVIVIHYLWNGIALTLSGLGLQIILLIILAFITFYLLLVMFDASIKDSILANEESLAKMQENIPQEPIIEIK